MVDTWESRMWREDLDSETTLWMYKSKADIGEEGYVEILLGRCSCSDVEPTLWVSDGGIHFLVGLWTVYCVELWRRRWSILWWSVVV